MTLPCFYLVYPPTHSYLNDIALLLLCVFTYTFLLKWHCLAFTWCIHSHILTFKWHCIDFTWCSQYSLLKWNCLAFTCIQHSLLNCNCFAFTWCNQHSVLKWKCIAFTLCIQYSCLNEIALPLLDVSNRMCLNDITLPLLDVSSLYSIYHLLTVHEENFPQKCFRCSSLHNGSLWISSRKC